MKKTILITGSLGLIGFESTLFFMKKGHIVIGVDNNFRQKALGVKTNYASKLAFLHKKFPHSYIHSPYDLCNKKYVTELFEKYSFSAVIHTAGQTSHDWASNNAFVDCSENTITTLNLLESTRKYTPQSSFIYTSTNKVYGDLVNTLPFDKNKTRFDLPQNHPLYKGIPESFSTDRSLHSLFGVSKLSADMYVQEYGRHFGINTACFRLGVVAGRGQNGSLEQGFLSYLLKQATADKPIEIIGYKGKQVRDIIAASDVAAAFDRFLEKPRPGAVYNMGGGRSNAYSLLEIIKKLQKFAKNKIDIRFNPTVRSGDHKWWISDYSLFTRDYSGWSIQKSVDDIIDEMLHITYD